MNAVARLWDALGAGDLERAADELHAHAVVEWPHSRQRFASRAAYLAAWGALHVDGRLEVRHVVTEGRTVATEVRIEDERRSWAVASFFRLHDGRVLQAVEYWVALGDRD